MVSVSAWVTVNRIANNGAFSAQICVRIHRLDIALQGIVAGSVPTVGELGRFTYYRDHPAEAAQMVQTAQQAAVREIERLAQADCQTGGTP